MLSSQTTQSTKFLYRISAAGSNRVYVGQTGDPEERWRKHRWTAAKGIHPNEILGRFLTKHKDAIFVYWPCSGDIGEGERLLEIAERENGFDVMNLVPCGLHSAGMTGKRHSEATRAKMRASSKCRKGMPKPSGPMSEEGLRRLVASKVGRPRTAEVRAKMSSTMKGRPWSSARRAAQEKRKNHDV